MRIGVMQPYFFPYLGYFHLAKAVDILVLTDDYKFTKQSWINRNRIISEKKIEYITIPLMKSSDSTHINKKVIALDFKSNNLQNKLYNSYHSAVNYMGLCNILNSENWFALYTKPRSEKKLSNLFKKFNIEYYLPTISIKKKWSDRFKTIETPLFTSYIFVRINYRNMYVKVLNVCVVTRLV